MASTISCPISKWIPAPSSKERLDYIQLVNLDLSRFDDLEGRQELARDFYKAFTEEGFLTLSGHGISEEVWAQQMDLAYTTMTLPPEEKALYEVTPEEDKQGIYAGFKEAGGKGFHREIDFYNMLLNGSKERIHPPHLNPYMEETRKVMLHVRDDIQRKLLILLAMCLEMPEEELLATHKPGLSSSEYYRYMSYSPLSEEATIKSRGLFMPGHADWGTFSILFSQPVCALQVLDKTGVFKWVEYIPNVMIVNIGQCLELLTGGLFRATIHRVVTPPQDQKKELRVGIFYFSRPNDDLLIEPLRNSPVLRRLGFDKPLDPNITYTATGFLEAKKNGYLKPDFDFDRPRDAKLHSDPFREGDSFSVLAKPLVAVPGIS
ncbi:putative clavaminate synthase-like protein [Coleophoma cylindrospora]|uniref:Putative clavaminate synthase-like protein n=1 Tax=Coleophoma cylindrospora TaxID=1849047 RepID=A0A3D8SFT2_9HELO|nr:putative clavaminate synthase-like protein [Coleophoma cylindrospora]